ncbi:hypothetical protein HYV22_00610, partial [Candidatus Gottesmanbacteria bacterium]|nr:hypothetical protein [Candidatus Gottesmanbacteria bacterium]
MKQITNLLAFLPKDFTKGLLVITLVVGAFLLGSLKTKVDFYEKGQVAGATNLSAQAAPAQQQPSPPTITLDQIKNVFQQDVIKFGDANKKVLFVEIADPSCPYCHIAAGENGELNKQVGDRFTLVADGGTYIAPVPEMKKLVDSGKAAFAYIYYPGHGNGEMGAKALYCAAEKGKFWEVHDLLMTSKGYDLINNTVKNDKAKSGELAEFLKSAFDAASMKACLAG